MIQLSVDGFTLDPQGELRREVRPASTVLSTSADGFWVATMRWIPAAPALLCDSFERASIALRSSGSDVRSAYSSRTTNHHGIVGRLIGSTLYSGRDGPAFAAY